MRDLVVQKPVLRSVIMPVLLECTLSPLEDVRGPAVRLCTNVLFAKLEMADTIEQFARSSLAKALDPDLLKDLPFVPAPAEVDLLQLQEEIAPVVDASLTDAQKAELTLKLRQKQILEKRTAIRDYELKKKLHELRDTARSTAVDRHLVFYFALCTRKTALLAGIFTAFAQAGIEAFVQSCIIKRMPEILRAVGTQSPAVISALMSSPKQGCDELCLAVLKNMTDSTVTARTLNVATDMFMRANSDARYMVPMIKTMNKPSLHGFLGVFAQLEKPDVEDVIARILALNVVHTEDDEESGQAPEAAMTPVQLLTELHFITPQKDSKLQGDDFVRKQIVAIDVCFDNDIFNDPTTLALVVERILASRSVVPLLFMRTLMQVLAVAPQLSSFVVDVLNRLLDRSIWQNEQLWTGFVRCVAQTSPLSIPVVLALPQKELKQVVEKLTDTTVFAEYVNPLNDTAVLDAPPIPFRAALVAYVSQQPRAVSFAVRRLLASM
jgi:hypothetical protein